MNTKTLETATKASLAAALALGSAFYLNAQYSDVYNDPSGWDPGTNGYCNNVGDSCSEYSGAEGSDTCVNCNYFNPIANQKNCYVCECTANIAIVSNGYGNCVETPTGPECIITKRTTSTRVVYHCSLTDVWC